MPSLNDNLLADAFAKIIESFDILPFDELPDHLVIPGDIAFAGMVIVSESDDSFVGIPDVLDATFSKFLDHFGRTAVDHGDVGL